MLAASHYNRAGETLAAKIIARFTLMDFAAARRHMVDSQLRTNTVMDPALLDAFLNVPRERFAPPTLQDTAYVDDDLPLGRGRAMLEPMVLARLLQGAEIGADDSVLDIGCGSGYGAAIMARVAKSVVAVEEDAELAKQARARLAEFGMLHTQVVEGPLTAGHAAGAPYDLIVIEGAVTFVPDAIAAQLRDGGRLATVVRDRAGMGEAMLMTRINGVLSRRPIFDAGTPLLPGFARAPSFVF